MEGSTECIADDPGDDLVSLSVRVDTVAFHKPAPSQRTSAQRRKNIDELNAEFLCQFGQDSIWQVIVQDMQMARLRIDAAWVRRRRRHQDHPCWRDRHREERSEDLSEALDVIGLVPCGHVRVVRAEAEHERAGATAQRPPEALRRDVRASADPRGHGASDAQVEDVPRRLEQFVQIWGVSQRGDRVTQASYHILWWPDGPSQWCRRRVHAWAHTGEEISGSVNDADPALFRPVACDDLVPEASTNNFVLLHNRAFGEPLSVQG